MTTPHNSAGLSEELLPCPFCGSGNIRVFTLDDDTDVVTCDECNGQGGYYSDDSTQPHEAAEFWNRRPSRNVGPGVGAVTRAMMDAACKAYQPDLFSEDEVQAHRAASPSSLAPARHRAWLTVERILKAALTAAPQPTPSGEEGALAIALAGMLDSFGGYSTPEVDRAISAMQAVGVDRWAQTMRRDPPCFICRDAGDVDGDPCPLCKPEISSPSPTVGGWRPGREEVARLIDPHIWRLAEERIERNPLWSEADRATCLRVECQFSLAKADAILALPGSLPVEGELSVRDPSRLSADLLTGEELEAEQARLDREWDKLTAALEECGGRGGSPRERLAERMDEIDTEIKRRATIRPQETR